MNERARENGIYLWSENDVPAMLRIAEIRPAFSCTRKFKRFSLFAPPHALDLPNLFLDGGRNLLGRGGAGEGGRLGMKRQGGARRRRGDGVVRAGA